MEDIRYKIFDDMLEGIQIINPEWQYVYVNKAVAEQGKSSKEKLLGKTMMEMYPGIENTQMFYLLRECMENRVNKTMVNEFDFPDGSKGYFELRMEPVSDGVLILSLDITEQKRLEVKLAQLNKHLEERVNERTKELADALEREKELNLLKSRFVAVASHEFKTPLGAIQISVNVLETCNDGTPQHGIQRTELYGYIKSSVKSMFEILNDFLSLEKLEQGKVNSETEQLDLTELINNEAQKMKLICKEGQNINYTHKGKKEITTDKQILKSVFLNLLSNAIKYSDKDIDIITSVDKDDIMHLKIIDKGIGIPEKEQKKLYQKFFRASNTEDIEGTGLGLNIVKRYIDLLGGSIDCSSTKNKGTTFQVKLPTPELIN